MLIKKTILLVFITSSMLFSVPIIEPMSVIIPKMSVTIPVTNKLIPKMSVTVSPMNILIYPIKGDVDGDGIPNSSDAFPDNPNEWYDTDHDGIGNNADTDDDGDGMSDVLERKYHFNPLNAADGSADADGDGFSNATEVGLEYNPLSRASHPIWVPLIMGDIMAFVPARP